MTRSRLTAAVPVALLLVLLGCGSALAGRFEEPAPEDAVGLVEDEYIVLFEDAEPDHKGRALGLAKKYELEMTSQTWDIVKGFAFRSVARKASLSTPWALGRCVGPLPACCVMN